jgi:hypothetical protein
MGDRGIATELSYLMLEDLRSASCPAILWVSRDQSWGRYWPAPWSDDRRWACGRGLGIPIATPWQ